MKSTLCICFLVAIITYSVRCNVSDYCLDCICQAAGCNSLIGRCVGNTCGPFLISEPYWIDCGRPGGNYQSCTKQKACSERCVRAYMVRYGNRCTGGRTPTCQDYARIHYGGPTGCRKDSTMGFWNQVKRCL